MRVTNGMAFSTISKECNNEKFVNAIESSMFKEVMGKIGADDERNPTFGGVGEGQFKSFLVNLQADSIAENVDLKLFFKSHPRGV